MKKWTKKEYIKKKRFFLRFLKENGIYCKYEKYINSPKTYNIFQKTHKNWTFDSCVKTNGFINMISILINWESTDEGFDFWKNMHFNYLDEYTKKFPK